MNESERAGAHGIFNWTWPACSRQDNDGVFRAVQMADSSTDRGPSEGDASFGGARVIAFESRMAAEMAEMIRRRGGLPTVAPSMREAALKENPAALDFARRLVRGEVDVAIFLTGVGVETLIDVLQTRYSRAALAAALGRIITVARGPKSAHALRALGVAHAIVVAEPNTSREVLSALDAAVALSGKRVAVQEYGVSNRELIAALEARGAELIVVPVYRWTLPENREPLRDAIRSIAARDADIVLFTSSTQVTNVIGVAEADGLVAALRSGLAGALVGSIGPVCSSELRARGVGVDFEPTHPRLGHLVKEAAARAAAALAIRRATAGARVTPGDSSSMPADGALDRGLRDHPMMKACRREPAPYTPIWLMRQAGRYMPEYRRIRERLDFLQMCRRPEVAAEVTLLAVDRLGVDAGIIFADILLPLIPMDVGLRYEEGDGPIIDRPVRSDSDVDRIPAVEPRAELGFVAEAIGLSRASLKVPLIGFAGAPFTLASYLIEGRGSRQYQATKSLMYRAPALWHRLMEKLATLTAAYLNMQIDAGVEIVQLFDSWVGSLGPDDYRRFVLPHTAAVIGALRPGVPVIHFGTVTGNLLELMGEAGGDVIGLDWRVNLADAWTRLGERVAVQGNLDPIALFAAPGEIRRRAGAILEQAGGRPGHIFNLGHGILPDTPVDHVIALVDAVHEMSRR